MNIAELTQTHGWKNFMAKMYGLGAAVVIVGALFKLTHWPGANLMLTVGLLTEAAIFFFSAFEPLHEEVDWTLAYPELAGLGIDDEIDIPVEDTKLPATGGEAMVKFNEMLEKAGDSNIFEKFGKGIESLNTTASKMSDISNAVLATDEYTSNMKSASGVVSSFNDSFKKSTKNVSSAVSGLVESYNKSADSVNYSTENLNDSLNKSAETVLNSTNNLSDSFSEVSKKVSDSGVNFTEAYQRLTDSMDVDFSALKGGNQEYNEHIGKLNKNLAALNAIFELQLNEADLDKMMEDLQGSVEESRKYNSEVNKLGQKLVALNTVYGNMLTAMNVKTD